MRKIGMSYQDDKRELLKLKQGIIDESESVIHEEEKPVYDLHGRKKAENFWYHNKWYVIAGVFFAAALTFMLVTTLGKKQGDIRVMVVTKNKEISANVTYKTQEFEEAFELYCRDYDDSGYVHVDIYSADLSENADPQYMLAGVTKVTSEILFGETQMFIVDREGAEAITNGDLTQFVDLSALYPDIEFTEGRLYKIKGTPFAQNCQYYEACPDDLYIAVHNATEQDENHARSIPAKAKALETLDNIIRGNYAGWVDDQGRIYGITQKETTAQ
ncbi:MAG: hypothetical protein IJT87_09105 [Ruminiclostridium sp.]|nr:hypothetical protein [Ruminiclostridium sp.]